MMWILLVLLLLGAAVGCTVAVRASRGGGRASGLDLPPGPGRIRCLRCHGTGWLGGEPERTFTFTGDGFADRHTPATPCPDCGGSGLSVAPRRPSG